MATLIAYGQFITSKLGQDGLTVTVDVEQITRANGTRVALVTDGSATPVGRRGLYYYLLADANIVTYDYVFTFVTTNTDVDQREIAALWTLYSISWHDIATSIMTLAGSIGKLLVDMLDAAISTRSTVTVAQVNAECDSALADYDPPTKAEMDAGLAALNDLSAAEVNAEVDTALAGYDPPTKAELDAGLAALNDPTASEIALAVGQRQIPDSYAADGAQPTIEQALLAIVQFLQERAVSGTTVTVKKPDGSTTAMTLTLNDAANPTSITRSS